MAEHPGVREIHFPGRALINGASRATQLQTRLPRRCLHIQRRRGSRSCGGHSSTITFTCVKSRARRNWCSPFGPRAWRQCSAVTMNADEIPENRSCTKCRYALGWRMARSRRTSLKSGPRQASRPLAFNCYAVIRRPSRKRQNTVFGNKQRREVSLADAVPTDTCVAAMLDVLWGGSVQHWPRQRATAPREAQEICGSNNYMRGQPTPTRLPPTASQWLQTTACRRVNLGGGSINLVPQSQYTRTT